MKISKNVNLSCDTLWDAFGIEEERVVDLHTAVMDAIAEMDGRFCDALLLKAMIDVAESVEEVAVMAFIFGISASKAMKK